MLMHPDQTPPPAPPPVNPHTPANQDQAQPGSNPYAFIFEEKKKSKKSMLPKGNSAGQRIILAVGGLCTLLLLVVLVIGLLGSKDAANKVELESLAQQEAEIIRVAGIGLAKAHDPTTKNLAATTSSDLSSNQIALLAALKRNGIKVSAKDLAFAKNPDTDTALTEADQTNTFDSAFTQELTKELSAFRTKVQAAYNSTSSKSLSQALGQAYQETGVLLALKTSQ